MDINLNKDEIIVVLDALVEAVAFDKNADEIVESIFKYLPQGPQYYDEDTVTDQPMRQIVAEIIREKALHALNEEIPHGIAVTIEKMKERKKDTDNNTQKLKLQESKQQIKNHLQLPTYIYHYFPFLQLTIERSSCSPDTS